MDNTQDMIRKGRKVVVIASPERRFDIGAWRVKNMPFIGSLHPRAKLNEDKVRLIKSALAAGEKGVDIARRFGCSVHTVSLINAGKQWRHVK